MEQHGMLLPNEQGSTLVWKVCIAVWPIVLLMH